MTVTEGVRALIEFLASPYKLIAGMQPRFHTQFDFVFWFATLEVWLVGTVLVVAAYLLLAAAWYRLFFALSVQVEEISESLCKGRQLDHWIRSANRALKWRERFQSAAWWSGLRMSLSTPREEHPIGKRKRGGILAKVNFFGFIAWNVMEYVWSLARSRLGVVTLLLSAYAVLDTETRDGLWRSTVRLSSVSGLKVPSLAIIAFAITTITFIIQNSTNWRGRGLLKWRSDRAASAYDDAYLIQGSARQCVNSIDACLAYWTKEFHQLSAREADRVLGSLESASPVFAEWSLTCTDLGRQPVRRQPPGARKPDPRWVKAYEDVTAQIESARRVAESPNGTGGALWHVLPRRAKAAAFPSTFIWLGKQLESLSPEYLDEQQKSVESTFERVLQHLEHSKIYDRDQALADMEEELNRCQTALESVLFNRICISRAELQVMGERIRRMLIPMGWGAKLLQFRKA